MKGESHETKGHKKYGRWDNVVQEAGDSDPPVPLYSVLNNRNKYGELEYTMSM